MRTRESVDLFAILFAATLLVLIVFVAPDASVLRIALGLPFVLFFPGYALVTALFPGSATSGARAGLGALERVALSLGLSIAVVPLLGLALNYTPWGIRLVPVILTTYGFTILLGTVALVRRHRLPEIARPEFVVQVPRLAWRTLAPLDRVLVIAAALAVLLAGAATAYVVVAPRPGESFTEFYVLGPGGKAEGYPTRLAPGDNARVIVGVVDHEHAPVTYTVEATLVPVTFTTNETGAQVPHDGTSTPLTNYTLTLQDGQTRETDLDVHVPTTGTWRLQLDLHKEGAQGAYRTLHLWINAPAGSGT